MRRVLAIAVIVSLMAPALASAKNGSGPGSTASGGNSGHGGGSSHGGGQGGGNGGHGGGNGGHGGGGNGGHGGGGGSTGGGSASGASAGSPASDGGSTSNSTTYDGGASGTGTAYSAVEREQVHADARECDPFGDITFRTHGILRQFTYGGLEFHLPTFVQCMKDKGYGLSSAGRNELTNFGTR